MLARTVLMALCRSRDSASQRFPNCSLQRASRKRTLTVFGDEKKKKKWGWAGISPDFVIENTSFVRVVISTKEFLSAENTISRNVKHI